MASAPNVIPQGAESLPRSLFGRPTKRAYRAAVKQIILDVKAIYGLSSDELAERIGCHKDTVDNAEGEASSLEAVTLLNIAYAFGEEAILPVRNLYLFAAVEQRTPLERITRANREIAAAAAEIGGAA